METSLNRSANVWNSELGEFISEDHRRFAEVLRDLKPTYSLVYIPKADRTTQHDREKPWAILESPKNLPPYIVRYLSEAEMANPQAVLGWLISGDLDRNSPQAILQQIEAEEKARQLMELKRREDELEDMLDFNTFVLSGGRDKRHNIRHEGKVFRR